MSAPHFPLYAPLPACGPAAGIDVPGGPAAQHRPVQRPTTARELNPNNGGSQ